MQVLPQNEEKEVVLSARLLIVDADAYLRRTLRQQFVIEGFNNVFDVGNVANFDITLRNTDPDFILLDIQIPDGDAIEICQNLRRDGFAKPIVMLTTKGAEGDIIPGLEAGANDYIEKPLRMGELLARIRIQLRQFSASNDAQIKIGDLIFLPANKTLHEINGDQPQKLTEKESAILRFLYEAFPNEVTKSQLLSAVWGFHNGVSTHTLETHVYRLRQKISQFSKKQLVLTTEKGYRLAN